MHRRPLCTALAALAALVLALPLGGCGDVWDYDGNVIVDNRTDAGTPADATAFRLARFGDPWTGNLLPAPLPAGSTRHVGEWHEDYYDAVADMSVGSPAEWFDVWVFADEDNFFDIY